MKKVLVTTSHRQSERARMITQVLAVSERQSTGYKVGLVTTNYLCGQDLNVGKSEGIRSLLLQARPCLVVKCVSFSFDANSVWDPRQVTS